MAFGSAAFSAKWLAFFMMKSKQADSFLVRGWTCDFDLRVYLP